MTTGWIFLGSLTPGWQFLLISLAVTLVGCALVGGYDSLARKHGWEA